MTSEREPRMPNGERRYPNGERMREEDYTAPEEQAQGRPCRTSVGRFVPAAVLLSVGGIFLLSNLGLFHAFDIWRYWPLILIASGVYQLSRGGQRSGMGKIIAGSIFLVLNLGILHVGFGTLWPLVLIGIGLYLFTENWTRRSPATSYRAEERSHSDDYLDNVALFGGVKRLIQSQNFRGGTLNAIFGGIEIDLRAASIRRGDGPAVIEANAIFGGITLKVPDTWRIAVRGTGIFGGYQDEARRLRQDLPDAPLLVVEGSATFGGVVIE